MSDGLNGLAAAIMVASGAMVLGGAGLFALSGRLLADASSWRGRRRGAVIALGAGLGVALGACLVTATFFETVWRPPPTLRFTVPPGFRQNWVILLEDRARGRPIAWRGAELPFTGLRADIAMPAGGIVRVASLDRLAGDGNVRATWSDGAAMVGFTGGGVPRATGATAFVAYEREHGLGYDPRDDLPTEDEATFTRYIAQREREAPPRQ